MARGGSRGRRTSYVRDNSGRFASTPGTTGTKAKPAAKRAQRGTNRLTRDNSGKITGVGKNGATARGGRLRTAAGNQRGAVLERVKKRQSPSGAIRATDVGKAKVHNTVSKMAEKRNKTGLNNPVLKVENKAARLMAASKRIAGQYRTGPAAPTRPAQRGKKAKVDDSKVSRVIGRLNNVVRGAEQKAGVKRLNATQVGVRAKSFLARREGGSVGLLNQMSQPDAFASVRRAMTKPPRYSTQKPNRNKPGRFNDLGQDKARIKARRDAMTARDRIQEGNQSAAAKAKAQKPKLSKAAIKGGAWSRRELGYGTSRNGFALAARIKGTVPKPRQQAKVSTTMARTRSQAKASQRRRREITLNRVRTGSIGMGVMRRNPRIRAVDTGMSQLSLMGKPKKLKRYRPVK